MGKPPGKSKTRERDDDGLREKRMALERSVSNRIVRAQLKSKRMRDEKRSKSAIRRKRQKLEASGVPDESLPPRQTPKTIESERVYDEETGQPLTQEEALAIEDEFSATLSGEVKPSVTITTGLEHTTTSYQFIQALLPIVSGVYYERKKSSISEFCAAATAKNFSDVLIVKEDRKKLTTLTHVHLPSGPTAVYKLSSYVPSKRIQGHGRQTGHTPEVILNNFTTSLGVRVGRMLGSLFPHTPNFVGRQAVTFHNQRDYIFFRFHRYIFTSSRDKARLQELGPRFTLKLRNLQKGIFQDPEKAENEFRWKTKTDINRRRFFL